MWLVYSTESFCIGAGWFAMLYGLFQTGAKLENSFGSFYVIWLPLFYSGFIICVCIKINTYKQSFSVFHMFGKPMTDGKHAAFQWWEYSRTTQIFASVPGALGHCCPHIRSCFVHRPKQISVVWFQLKLLAMLEVESFFYDK